MILVLYISTLAVIGTGCFILGFHVFSRDRTMETNSLFFINSLLLNAVIIFTVLIQLSENAVTAKFIQGIYNIFLIIFLLESLYFSLVFTGHRMNKLIRGLLSVYTAVVFMSFILNNGSYLHLSRSRGIWVYELVNLRFWFLVYSPLLAMIVILMLYSLFSFSRRAKSNKEKKQAGIMMFSILLACSLGFCFLMILPLFDVFRVPLLTPYFFVVYLTGVFIAITRYRFMVSGIKDIALDALSYIDDMVIITGVDKRILDMNRSALLKLASGAADLKGRRITDITDDGDRLDLVLQEILVSGGAVKYSIAYSAEPEPVVTESTISAVWDSFGDISALLIVSRENRGMSHFRKFFRLTEREMDVVLLTISGVKNTGIASKLNITKRTVETHQNNIYNKLGINNRIELLNITGDFGIKPI